MNVIVTGCSRGIGLELVKLFCADEGNNVIGISRNIGSVVNEIKTAKDTFFYPITYDLNSLNIDLKEIILSKINSVDILINNVGLLINKRFEDFTDDEFDLLFNTNVKSVFKLVRLFIDSMNNPSHIVNISSMGGFQGSAKFSGLSLYSSSKGALNTLTECMAEEFKDKGISVNSLCLGAVNTEMLRIAFPGYKAQTEPDKMASFIKNFSENCASVFNGKILPVSITTP